MPDLDIIAPQFRLATERWPDAPTLANHYRAVAECYAGTGHSLIASVKSFIECVCLTLLGEFGKTMPSSDPTTTELLVEALKTVGLQNSRGASKVDKILSAHNKMADALNEMRNDNDPVAHGKDGFLDVLTANECRAYLVTADAILALLLAAYVGKEPNLEFTREPYDRFERFHRRIDESVTMGASINDETGQLTVNLRVAQQDDGIDLILEPSKLLYAVDRTIYVDLLRATTPPAPTDEPESRGAPIVTGPFAEASSVTTQVVSEYNGPLSRFKVPIQDFLASLGGLEAVAASTNLRDSLLATAERNMGLDWTEREPLRAAMKVALKRTLTKFGVAPDRAEQTAERLVEWFKTNTSAASAA